LSPMETTSTAHASAGRTTDPRTSLNGFLDGYASSGVYPFHMPGHKRNAEFFGDLSLHVDVTELPGADNLHDPRGVIKSLEARTAAIYGAARSFLLVNGSTAGVQAAILAACATGDELILARNCHRSAFAGLMLSGASPVYIYPEITEYGIVGGVSPESVESALEKHRARAVLLTSPTYEGFCSDIGRIARIAHAHGALLIVDEAHGAHFPFHTGFPVNALAFGADIVINSLHKTLPAPTQTAVIHVSPSVDEGSIQKALLIIQTSSPSYIFMSLMERCYDLCEGYGNYQNFIRRLAALREELGALRAFKLIDGSIIGQAAIFDMDMAKLVFVLNGGLTGSQFNERMRRKRIQIEMGAERHAILIATVADTAEGFGFLKSALFELELELEIEGKARELKRAGSVGEEAKAAPLTAPALVMTPREAYDKAHRGTELVGIEYCAGRISGGFVTPYPPGIPLVAPGEAFSAELAAHVKSLLAKGLNVLGAVDGRVEVLRH